MKKMMLGIFIIFGIFAVSPLVFAQSSAPYINLARANDTLVASGNVANQTSALLSFYADSNIVTIDSLTINSDGTFSFSKSVSDFPDKVTGYSACLSLVNSTLICSNQVISSYVLNAPKQMQDKIDQITTLVSQFSNLTNLTDTKTAIQDLSAEVEALQTNQIMQDDIDASVSSAKSDLQGKIDGLNTKIDTVDANAKSDDAQQDKTIADSANNNQMISLATLVITLIAIIAVVFYVKRKLGKSPASTKDKPRLVLVTVKGDLTDEKLAEMGKKINLSLKNGDLDKTSDFVKNARKDEEWWLKLKGMVY